MDVSQRSPEEGPQLIRCGVAMLKYCTECKQAITNGHVVATIDGRQFYFHTTEERDHYEHKLQAAAQGKEGNAWARANIGGIAVGGNGSSRIGERLDASDYGWGRSSLFKDLHFQNIYHGDDQHTTNIPLYIVLANNHLSFILWH